MLKTILFVSACLMAFSLSGQSLLMELGTVKSGFIYEDSQGEPLQYSKGVLKPYMGLGYRQAIGGSKWHYAFGAAYNGYGASAHDTLLMDYYSWDVTFLGVNASMDYEFYKYHYYLNSRMVNFENGFTFHIKLAIAGEMMVHGTQVINDRIYNLMKVEQFNKPILFARGGGGATYYISKDLSIYLQYLYGQSILIAFGEQEPAEKLRYSAHTVNFGVSLNFKMEQTKLP